MLLFLSLAASAGASEQVSLALGQCKAAVYPLPALTAAQVSQLAAGEVVRIVHHSDPEQPSTAVGIALLKAPRDALWIAAQDPHAQVDPALIEFVVAQQGLDAALWYGHLDLPRPLKDRQWVVASKNSHALATASGGGCWEHTWSLVPDGLPRARAMVASGASSKVTLAQIDGAVFTPVNHGNWLMAPVSKDTTIVAYQATSVVGGAIPDWLVLQLSMARLDAVLRDLEKRAKTWSGSHYVAGHAPVAGGAGAPIPIPSMPSGGAQTGQ